MLKKVIKMILTILMFILIINILEMKTTRCYADGFTDVSENLNFWDPTDSPTQSSLIKEKVGVIITVVRTVGLIISVVSLMIIGIKYMLGSLEEKAQYKQTMIPWIIGAIMVFAITAIPSLIYDMSTGIL